jgi:hypothetical protein
VIASYHGAPHQYSIPIQLSGRTASGRSHSGRGSAGASPLRPARSARSAGCRTWDRWLPRTNCFANRPMQPDRSHLAVAPPAGPQAGAGW